MLRHPSKHRISRPHLSINPGKRELVKHLGSMKESSRHDFSLCPQSSYRNALFLFPPSTLWSLISLILNSLILRWRKRGKWTSSLPPPSVGRFKQILSMANPAFNESHRTALSRRKDRNNLQEEWRCTRTKLAATQRAENTFSLTANHDKWVNKLHAGSNWTDSFVNYCL